MKYRVKMQTLAMRDNLKEGKGSASGEIGRREYYSVNFHLIRVIKWEAELQSWHVQRAARLTSFTAPGSELCRGANWCRCRRRSIVEHRKSGASSCLLGHWSLIIIFPRAFSLSEKDMLISERIIFPGSYHEDVCWHVRRGGPSLFQQVAAKWRGVICITKIKLILDLNIHHFNECHKPQWYFTIILGNDPFLKFLSWISCHSDETHVPVKWYDGELFWGIILGVKVS